jgi:hypothetical protein
MQQHSFNRIDICMGWLAFAIALVVYGTSVEPTASLWDCPEFIASGYRLEIGHPPGAPFFMLTANLFSHLAATPSQVALMVNLMSALLSAGCILFLFWTITHFARKLIVTDGTYTRERVLLIESCGMVGALAYAFSDTFWFSATEAEVYAYSSFLTAVVFWLMLKWEEEADCARSCRWVILIAYLIGLSIGVHLLNLLCIPAMVLVFCFRRSERAGFWGILLALTISAAIVALVLYGIIPGVVWLAGLFELFFVNVCSLPYHSGLLCLVLLMLVGLPVCIWHSRRRAVRVCLLSLSMLLLGYSTYGVILIRASARPPMNENAPDNVFSLRSYLAREQYGDTPLLYGPAYTSKLDYEQKGDYWVAKSDDEGPVYRPSADTTVCRYDVIRHDLKYRYADNMWFPRMHDKRFQNQYEDWMGGVEKKDGQPTMMENIRFFLSYQVNFMYWRYFLWNFVGRQNDIQGHGEAEHGNWITGISFIDNLLLGCDTSKMPDVLRQNPGRNVYYALPLLLGLMGLYWQLGRGAVGRNQFCIVSVLFFMTGLAIVLYLNQTPHQARERDYAYAGSFYAFSLWIGLGVAAVHSLFGRLRMKGRLRAMLSSVLCLLVPLQMISQTWDDHDRSGRYTCRDYGQNYLQSLPQEGCPIILTNGDNDTFPLWYNHDVEGFRTDTRVCNLSYAQTDWYIDQMKQPAWQSPALPFTWDKRQYQEGTRERIPVRPELEERIRKLYRENPDEMKKMLGDDPFELKNVIKHWILSDNPDMQCIPTDTVTLTSPDGSQQMTLSFKDKEALFKSDLFVLEVLSHAMWTRPLYLSVSVGPDEVSWLRNHLVLEGLAYRIVPQTTNEEIDVDKTYRCFMNLFRYGGLSDPTVYADEHVRHLAYTHERVMARLIDALLDKGDNKRAMDVAVLWQREFPLASVPHNELALSLARAFYAGGSMERADAVLEGLLCQSDQWLSWMETFSPDRKASSSHNVYRHLRLMQLSLALAGEYQRQSLMQSFTPKFIRYAEKNKPL